jgi:NADPH:quinone reductase-like Zn-dependent oxidoreductase
MKAAYIEEIGGPEKLIVGERPTPEAGAGQMLVRTKAAGVGPWDWKIMGGMFGSPSMPLIPGLEVAGIVEQAGPDAGFTPGDEVFASTGFTAGGFAQYIGVDPQVAALKPSRLSFEEAAALVVGGGTAYEGLADVIKLQPGETVLITAASGGVGTMAVQIAVALGHASSVSLAPATWSMSAASARVRSSTTGSPVGRRRCWRRPRAAWMHSSTAPGVRRARRP